MTPGQAKRRHLTALVGPLFNGVAPKGTTSPYVIADELGAEDVTNGMGTPGAVEFEPRVYAVAEGERFPSTQAQTIIDALDKATTQQGDYEVYSHRLRPYEDAFSDDSGRQFRREGADFRVLVRRIPQEP